MGDQRVYRVWVIHSIGGGELDYIVHLSKGEEILQKIRKSLSINLDDTLTINEIIETSNCEGCQIDACGQRDHMDHPCGCLHDSSDCDLCQIKIKNLMKLSMQISKDG